MTLVAVMTIWVPLFAAGALKLPSLEIEPADADQITAVLLFPRTVAVKRSFAVGLRLTVLGETAIWSCAAGAVFGVKLLAPQPTPIANTSQVSASIEIRWRVEANLRCDRENLGNAPCKSMDLTSLIWSWGPTARVPQFTSNLAMLSHLE
jgi:hypothetical protein